MSSSIYKREDTLTGKEGLLTTLPHGAPDGKDGKNTWEELTVLFGAKLLVSMRTAKCDVFR
jgi:hypothetical protein